MTPLTSTSRPPLILRVTVPVTGSPSLSLLMTSFHCRLLVGLPLADAQHAAVFRPGLFVFQVFDQHRDELPDLRRFFAFTPFVDRHRGFALEADIDHHVAVFDAENASFDDLVDVEIRTPAHAAVSGKESGLFKVLRGRLEQRLDVRIVFERANQGVINHRSVSNLRRIEQEVRRAETSGSLRLKQFRVRPHVGQRLPPRAPRGNFPTLPASLPAEGC